MHAKIRKKLVAVGSVFLVTALLDALSWRSSFFRNYYFDHFYPFVAGLQRLFFGWIPFSVGDLFYLLLSIVLLVMLAQTMYALFHIRKQAHEFWRHALNLVFLLQVLYLGFLALWGFNYRTHRVKDHFGIRSPLFSKSELIQLCVLLTREVNDCHSRLVKNPGDSTSFPCEAWPILQKAFAYYQAAGTRYPALALKRYAVKPSSFSYLMNYAGIAGYYNPFTGEAQLNTLQWPGTLPFVACHEIAHQLGFAQENAANFIGYFVAIQSPDPFFQYSAAYNMWSYAQLDLYRVDSLRAQQNYARLDKGVQKDMEAEYKFYLTYRNPVNPLLSVLYDRYLKANYQEKGIKSYHQVVGLLIAYYKKEGKL